MIVAPWFGLQYFRASDPEGLSERFLVSLLNQIYSDAAAWEVISILGAVYALSTFYALLLIYSRNLQLQALLQASLDLVLVTVLVVTFGGIYSPLSLLYPLVLLVATPFIPGRVSATTFATTALVLYSGVLLGELYRWQWPLERASWDFQDLSRMLYNFVVALVGFYGTVFLGLALSRQVREAKEELAEKRDSLADLQVFHEDIIQSINSGLITTDLLGNITTINRAGEAILALPAEGLLGRQIEASGLYEEGAWEAASLQCERRERYRDEVKLKRGRLEIHVGCSISHLQEATGQHIGYIVIFQDLTDYRHLQQELQIKDRMAAVGELAAGLAHEIGNPLAAISGSAQILAGQVKEEAEHGGLLRIILRESQRLDRTIKGFLQFARPRERSMRRFDLSRQLRENFALLQHSREVSSDHQLQLELQPESAEIIADPDQISQIFWNLARNALRAMPDGGTLTVRGRQRNDGRYALYVIDTGEGIPEEERRQIFQPFSTTFDGGTGIGMAIVYRIVQEHGGEIRVESTPGQGTEICIELPAGTAAVQQSEDPEVVH